MILKEIALHHLQTQYARFAKHLERVQASDEERPEVITGYARKYLGAGQDENLVRQLVDMHLQKVKEKQPTVGSM